MSETVLRYWSTTDSFISFCQNSRQNCYTCICSVSKYEKKAPSTIPQ